MKIVLLSDEQYELLIHLVEGEVRHQEAVLCAARSKFKSNTALESSMKKVDALLTELAEANE